MATNGMDLNGGLPIDLVNDGVTPNDPGDGDAGPNALQNRPLLTGSASGIVVSGTLSSTPSITFTLPVYGSPAADPSGSGQGARYLRAAKITIPTTADTFPEGNETLRVTLSKPVGAWAQHPHRGHRDDCQ